MRRGSEAAGCSFSGGTGEQDTILGLVVVVVMVGGGRGRWW